MFLTKKSFFYFIFCRTLPKEIKNIKCFLNFFKLIFSVGNIDNISDETHSGHSSGIFYRIFRKLQLLG